MTTGPAAAILEFEAVTARQRELVDDGLVDLEGPFRTGTVVASWQDSNCSLQECTL